MAWTTVFSDAFTGITNGQNLATYDGTNYAANPNGGSQLVGKNPNKAGANAFSQGRNLIVPTLNDDQAIEVDIPTWSGSGVYAFGLGLRATVTTGANDNFDAYRVMNDSAALSTWRLSRVDYGAGGSPSYTTLDTDTGGMISAGDNLRFEAVGTGLDVYINGSVTPTLSATDSSFSSGDAALYGLGYFGAEFYFDNLLVEDDGGGGGTPVSGTPLLSARLRRVATLLRM